MSDREAFEKWAKWNGYNTKWYITQYDDPRVECAYQAWQAAQAQAGDEVYVRIYDDENNGWCGAEDKTGKSVQIEEKLDGCYLLFGPLYTRPQPAVNQHESCKCATSETTGWTQQAVCNVCNRVVDGVGFESKQVNQQLLEAAKDALSALAVCGKDYDYIMTKVAKAIDSAAIAAAQEGK
jgi:hypothetical protein